MWVFIRSSFNYCAKQERLDMLFGRGKKTTANYMISQSLSHKNGYHTFRGTCGNVFYNSGAKH